MDNLAGRKKAVREAVLALRSGLDEADRAARSQRICRAIESLPEYAQARSILFFMPFVGEVDISPLLRSALHHGILCGLPRCCPGCRLKLYGIGDADGDVEPGRWGILEPKDCLNEYNVDDFSVIIVPGVAFDRCGRRLGHGAGYYDRLLAGAKALRIAPAFALQVLPELPHGEHDAPVHIIVTEQEIIDCRGAGE